MISALREWLYRGKVLRSRELPAYVVSVGNISMGGTGKTPLVMELCQWALQEGISVAVLSRGYGRKSRKLWALGPESLLPSAAELGDEPWLIKYRFPKVGLLVHSHRVTMALRHWKEMGSPQLVILDDGFQHWPAMRDLDLVLVDGARDVGAMPLPFGKLREPWSALARADLVIWQGGAPTEKRKRPPPLEPHLLPPWRKGSICHFPDAVSKSKVMGVFDPLSGSAFDCAGKELVVAVGIEKPERFLATLEGLGLRAKEFFFFRDHEYLNASSRDRIRASVMKAANGLLLLTEKDWARWQDSLKELPVAVVRIRSDLGDGLEPVFKEIKRCLSSG